MYLSANEILFIDIETVPQYEAFSHLPEGVKNEWKKKCLHLRSTVSEPSELYARAGIYAEFGKIICISACWFERDELISRSFFGEDEKQILTEFSDFVSMVLKKGFKRLCAHNGKEFDFPYIGRRMLINEVKLPEPFRIAGKKPWEVRQLDTMELWKFGDYKSYTSLSLLASVFGIPSPKEDIDGSEVGSVYWESGDLERIERYCRRDAETVARLYVKLAPSQEESAAW